MLTKELVDDHHRKEVYQRYLQIIHLSMARYQILENHLKFFHLLFTFRVVRVKVVDRINVENCFWFTYILNNRLAVRAIKCDARRINFFHHLTSLSIFISRCEMVKWWCLNKFEKSSLRHEEISSNLAWKFENSLNGGESNLSFFC